jgi:hypothetical protein
VAQAKPKLQRETETSEAGDSPIAEIGDCHLLFPWAHFAQAILIVLPPDSLVEY